VCGLYAPLKAPIKLMVLWDVGIQNNSANLVNIKARSLKKIKDEAGNEKLR
jgi:hypothetical protein